MMDTVLLIALSIAVVTGLFAALYVWFEVLGHRFHGATTDLPAEATPFQDASSGGLLGDRLRAMVAERT